jgi:hypothetical protein
MSEPVPALVTLHVWTVPPRRIPAAVLRMAADRGPVRHLPGLQFGKLMGTGAGKTFTLGDADPTRWALLSAWAAPDAAASFERSPLAARWDRLATQRWRADLQPLSSRGRWSGREPFGRPEPARWTGPVAALTRARLRPRRAATFWRAVPPVAGDLADRPGLRTAFGIGEAPAFFQGTFSVWDSGDALADFAYRRPAHLAAVRRTTEERWYVEELFARFAVLGTAGTLDADRPA